MSRNTKIILGVLAGALVLLCLCGGGTALLASLLFRVNSVAVSPERVESITTETLQIEPGERIEGGVDVAGIALPDGWVADYAIEVAGFRLVGYKPADGRGHIMLGVLPETSGADIEKLEQELRRWAGSEGYGWDDHDMRVVGRKPVTIRGQETEMVIAEGRGASGTWKQAMASFRGVYGLSLVLYGMPAETYSQAEADALFASIR